MSRAGLLPGSFFVIWSAAGQPHGRQILAVEVNGHGAQDEKWAVRHGAEGHVPPPDELHHDVAKAEYAACEHGDRQRKYDARPTDGQSDDAGQVDVAAPKGHLVERLTAPALQHARK